MAAIVAPLPGLGGAHDPLPMAILLVIMPAAAMAAWLVLSHGRRQPADTAAQPAG
jgi:hypothetical protein